MKKRNVFAIFSTLVLLAGVVGCNALPTETSTPEPSTPATSETPTSETQTSDPVTSEPVTSESVTSEVTTSETIPEPDPAKVAQIMQVNDMILTLAGLQAEKGVMPNKVKTSLLMEDSTVMKKAGTEIQNEVTNTLDEAMIDAEALYGVAKLSEKSAEGTTVMTVYNYYKDGNYVSAIDSGPTKEDKFYMAVPMTLEKATETYKADMAYALAQSHIFMQPAAMVQFGLEIELTLATPEETYPVFGKEAEISSHIVANFDETTGDAEFKFNSEVKNGTDPESGAKVGQVNTLASKFVSLANTKTEIINTTTVSIEDVVGVNTSTARCVVEAWEQAAADYVYPDLTLYTDMSAA